MGGTLGGAIGGSVKETVGSRGVVISYASSTGVARWIVNGTVGDSVGFADGPVQVVLLGTGRALVRVGHGFLAVGGQDIRLAFVIHFVIPVLTCGAFVHGVVSIGAIGGSVLITRVSVFIISLPVGLFRRNSVTGGADRG
jgi:hypothetical protein